MTKMKKLYEKHSIFSDKQYLDHVTNTLLQHPSRIEWQKHLLGSV